MLDVLDQHELTNCRNELQALDTDFRKLPRPEAAEDLPGDFLQRWEAAVHAARTRKSGRDRFDAPDKVYYRPGMGRLADAVMKRGRVRAALGMGGKEWELPGYFLKASATDRIIPVLKIGSTASWYLANHDSQPDQYIIHNIRRPQDYLNSWYNRFVRRKRETPQNVYAEVQAKASSVLTHFGRDPLPDIYSMENLIYGELWIWRGANEPLYTARHELEHYMLFRYEEISEDTVAQAQRAYEFAGLSFEERHRARLAGLKNVLFAKAHTDALPADLVNEQLGRVLEDSPLTELYPL